MTRAFSRRLLPALLVLSACSSANNKGSSSSPSSSFHMPLVTPPVKAATPSALRGSSSPGSNLAGHPQRAPSHALLSVSDFQSRFFSSGPTDILDNLLPAVDSLISNINIQATSDSADCFTQSPVAYSLTALGQSVPMFAQCFQRYTPSFDGDPAFIQFGVQDGATYIYSANGAEWEAVIITPSAGAADGGQYHVKAFIGLGASNTHGCSNTWDGCSYAAMELEADSAAHTFELAVAGMGIGYCGAQLKSDGVNLWAEGSTDMGSSCQPADNLCVSAADASTAGTCASPLTDFALLAIGRESTASTAPVVSGDWGVSAYPATANLLFDGTASDAVHFGPSAPTEGVGELKSTDKTK